MSSTAQASDTEHPLLLDRRLFDEVANVMYVKIQKVLFPRQVALAPWGRT